MCVESIKFVLHIIYSILLMFLVKKQFAWVFIIIYLFLPLRSSSLESNCDKIINNVYDKIVLRCDVRMFINTKW